MKHTLVLTTACTLFALAACNNASTSNNDASKTDNSATKTESKQERNKKVVMACMEGINAHDLDKLMRDASPDFVDYGDGSTPPAKKDSAKKMMAMGFNAFPDMKSENQTYLADGDNVVVISDWTMTFKNDIMGMKATGKTAKMKDVDIFTLDSAGKITSHRNIYPSGAMFMQLGCDMSKMEGMEKDMIKEGGQKKM